MRKTVIPLLRLSSRTGAHIAVHDAGSRTVVGSSKNSGAGRCSSDWGIPVVVIEPGGTDTAIFAKGESATRSAVEERKPSRRYGADSGTAIFEVLGHLPAGARERLIKAVFGLG